MIITYIVPLQAHNISFVVDQIITSPESDKRYLMAFPPRTDSFPWHTLVKPVLITVFIFSPFRKSRESTPHSYLLNRTPDLWDNLTQQKSLDRKNTRNYGYILSPFILREAVYLTWLVNIQCSLKVVVLCILVFFGTLWPSLGRELQTQL